jgi:hypothetical protein
VFSRSGRLSVIVAIGPAVSYSRVSNVVTVRSWSVAVS